MPSILRTRLVCFYCGSKSARPRDPQVRQWACEKCEAVNYLDEHGEITDPPTVEASAAVQYAVPVPRSRSPVSFHNDETLFCPTCLKNQHLLTQSLAAYLPPPNHPDYALYEASYPSYRASLEERYPQVCIDCEPRVRARIRAAGYVAKTDHLRRMMERTRRTDGRRGWMIRSWQEVVVLLGGLSWWCSVLSQLLASSIAIATPYTPDDALVAEDVSLVRCVSQCVFDHEADADCFSLANSIVARSLVAGLMGFWWNPCLMQKVRGSGGRMVGLRDFYALQLVVLAFRGLAAWTSWTHGLLGLEPAAVRGVHAFMLVFVGLTTLTSLRTVSINHNPRISFNQDIQPLKAGPSTHRPGATETFLSPPSSQRDSRSALSRNSSEFSGQRQQRTLNPPTPPSDDADSDAMDWTPTQAAFNPTPQIPATSLQPALPTSSFASFQRLPPAPKSQAAKLRNPPSTVPFFKSSSPDDRNLSFFHNMADGASPSKSALSDMLGSQTTAEMAPPRFFPPSDLRSDTGLEGLFDAAFSLKDEPTEVQVVREHGQASSASSLSARPPSYPRATGTTTTNKLPHLVTALLQMAALIAWTSANLNTHSDTTTDSSLPHPAHLRLAALTISGLTCGTSLLSHVFTSTRTTTVSARLTVLLHATELLVALSLASVLYLSISLSFLPPSSSSASASEYTSIATTDKQVLADAEAHAHAHTLARTQWQTQLKSWTEGDERAPIDILGLALLGALLVQAVWGIVSSSSSSSPPSRLVASRPAPSASATPPRFMSSSSAAAPTPHEPEGETRRRRDGRRKGER